MERNRWLSVLTAWILILLMMSVAVAVTVWVVLTGLDVLFFLLNVFVMGSAS